MVTKRAMSVPFPLRPAVYVAKSVATGAFTGPAFTEGRVLAGRDAPGAFLVSDEVAVVSGLVSFSHALLARRVNVERRTLETTLRFMPPAYRCFVGRPTKARCQSARGCLAAATKEPLSTATSRVITAAVIAKIEGATVISGDAYILGQKFLARWLLNRNTRPMTGLRCSTDFC